MATLFDRIKSNSKQVKTGSQLFETTPDTLASVTAGQGLVPGAAVSPGAAAGLGVTKDQAKMAGSGAQLESVVRESIQPSKTYRPEITGPRTLKTEEEKAREARAAQAESLQGLGPRLSTLVRQSAAEQFAAASAAGTLVKPVFQEAEFKKAYPELTDEQVARIKASVESGTPDVNLLKDLGISLGAKSAEEAMATLAKYVKQPEATIATVVGGTLGPDAKLSSLTPEQYKDFGLAEAAKALGLSDEEMRNLSISELQAKVEALASQDFTRVEELNRIANDPSYPENVRQDAQRQLRDLSSVSVAATEADMEKLNQEVQSADTFTIGDKTYSIEELLSDATLTSIVVAYLDGEDPDYVDTLKRDFFELATFIDDNRAALKAVAAKLGSGVKDLADTQIFNASLEKVNGVDLGAFNKETITDYDPNTPKNERYPTTPAHQLVMNDTGVPASELAKWQGNKLTYTQFLSDITKLNPAIAKEFANYDYQTIMDKVNNSGLTFNEYFNAYTNYQRDINAIADRANINDLGAVTSTIGTASDMAAFVKDYRLRQELGLPQISDKYTKLYKLIDSDGDGKVDDAGVIRKNMEDYYGTSVDVNKPTLKDLLSGSKIAQAAESTDAIYRAVKDGILDEAELDAIMATKDDKQLAKLYDILSSKGALVQADSSLMGKYTEGMRNRAIEVLGTERARYVTESTDALMAAHNNEVYAGVGATGRGKYTTQIKDRADALLKKYTSDISSVETAIANTTNPAQKSMFYESLTKLIQLKGLAEQDAIMAPFGGRLDV
jgi:hypothetical protein